MAKAFNAIEECIEENNDALTEDRNTSKKPLVVTNIALPRALIEVLRRMNRGGLIEKASLVVPSTAIRVSGHKKKSRRSGQGV